MNDKKYALGIVPGSFDPITNGHLDIINRASELCEQVVVAVMINPEKKYMFDMEQRKRIAEAALTGIENVRVMSSEGMLWELARDLGATAIIKGVRNEHDRKYEMEMAEYNEQRYPQAPTVLLECAKELEGVSSTLAREMILRDEGLSGVLPDAARREIKNILKRG